MAAVVIRQVHQARDLAKPGADRTLGNAEDRWMPSPVTAEGSGRDREIPVPDIPRR